jgi:anti-anti-sigma factor
MLRSAVITNVSSLSVERPRRIVPTPRLAAAPTPPRPRTGVAGIRRLSLAQAHDQREDARLQLRIRSVECGEYTVVSLDGELDVVTFERLYHALLRLLARHDPPRLVLDVADVAFADAYGLSPLVRAGNVAATRGGWLRLVRVSDRLRWVLDTARLAKALPAFDCVTWRYASL